MPVSVFVTVTSAPGIARLLESRTTPDSCDPATACAETVARVTRPSRSMRPTSARIAFTTAPPYMRGNEDRAGTLAKGRADRNAVTVLLPLHAVVEAENADNPCEWTHGAHPSSTPA